MTLGETFKQARERLGFSVSEMADKTRIKAQTLSEMERDCFKSFTAPIYGRGFVRIYAKALSLDPETMVAAYNAANPADDNARPAAGARLETFDSKNGDALREVTLSQRPAAQTQPPFREYAESVPASPPQLPPPAPAPREEPDLFSPAPKNNAPFQPFAPQRLDNPESGQEPPKTAFSFPKPARPQPPAAQQPKAAQPPADIPRRSADPLQPTHYFDADDSFDAPAPAHAPKRKFNPARFRPNRSSAFISQLKNIFAKVAASLSEFFRSLVSRKTADDEFKDPAAVARTRLSRWIAVSAGAVVLFVILLAAFSGSGKPKDATSDSTAETSVPAAEMSAAEPVEITRIAPPPLPFAQPSAGRQ